MSRTIELTSKRLAGLGLGLAALVAAAVAVGMKLAHHPSDAGHDAHAAHQAGEAHEHAGHQEGEPEEGKLKLSPAAIANAGLDFRRAGPGRVAVTLALPGEVSVNADAMAHVTPRVPGTVRTVTKALGERVKKGDVLATLDSRELAELQREFSAAKERLALAKATFQREEQLWKEKISAEKDYLAAEKALKEAEIDFRSASQKLQSTGAGSSGASYSLVAPLDGTIIEKHINIGEVLSDRTQTFTIADLSKLWVNVTVYARDLSRVRVGQTAIVRAEGISAPARGSIDFLGQIVGEQTRSATARIVLDNPGEAWRPGLFVTADVNVEEVLAPVVVAADAVQQVDGKTVVFVREGDVFEARPVRLGRSGSTGTNDALQSVAEVLAGLPAGTEYVAKNSFILKSELGKSEAGHEH
jgi:cobalt-zinc-cadmium efflux system membrane fusion protein